MGGEVVDHGWVERLDDAWVIDGHVDSVGGQLLGGADCGRQHLTEADQGNSPVTSRNLASVEA